MTNFTLHLLSQPPSQWQGVLDMQQSLLAQGDALVLLGNACAGLCTHEKLMESLQTQNNLTLYLLKSDVEKYGVNTNMVSPSLDVSVVSHEQWLNLCVDAERVVTW